MANREIEKLANDYKNKYFRLGIKRTKGLHVSTTAYYGFIAGFEKCQQKNKQLLDEIEKTKQFNLELIYSNKFKDKEIEMLKFQLKAADSVNEQYRIGLIEIKQSLTENRQKIIEAINQPK